MRLVQCTKTCLEEQMLRWLDFEGVVILFLFTLFYLTSIFKYLGGWDWVSYHANHP